MEYNFRDIEKKWQASWKANKVYNVSNESTKPKYYVLDMFPYPSGAGLHVGHPLGYIASDIYSRYKRLKGFNVLHPMGFDSFGLPAEQYALDTGQHPAVTTKKNIETFKSQLDNIGFCFDWSREVQTSDPEYYKWTQWIFLQLFKSFFNRNINKAEPIEKLIAAFEKEGNINNPLPSVPDRGLGHFPDDKPEFDATDWNEFSEYTKQAILMEYRLAYCGVGEVNWCEALGTVLANDEVVNGVSERGGYPVVRKKLRQWYLRITEYADRLLQGLETVDFSDAMKEMQRNWIGKSMGAEIDFPLENEMNLKVFTTRPDTVFGVDFMVIAPELDTVSLIVTPEQQKAVDDYLDFVKSRSERERMAEKKISGVFTGAYAIHPFDGRKIPIWVSEYVLAGYGTGAIMAVPCGDERDHKFAKHFNIPITNIIGSHYKGEEANPTKDAILENSGFLNDLLMKDAIEVATKAIEEKGIGVRKVNYKMHDAAFSRQRYWGEPFPIVWKDGIAYPLDESELPLELPHVDSYKPGPDGEGPLANIKEWALIPGPTPQAEKGAAGVPKYAVYTPMQYELAKRMRKEYTEAEGELWELLRNNKVGVKFRRQHPIDKYIVDFICLQERLIVEADGGYHTIGEQKFYDAERTRVLNDIGFEIIRFTNEEITKDPYKVKDRIKKRLEQKRTEALTSSPLHEVERGQGVRETNTMPGYAGSSWYFLRYMDPKNEKEFCSRKASDYWGQVDLYIGGTEHAVGHLLYSRMWTKVLFDLRLIGFDEPYKRLVNQGMIQGSSRIVYFISYLLGYDDFYDTMMPRFCISKSLADSFSETKTKELIGKIINGVIKNNNPNLNFTLAVGGQLYPTHIDVNIVDGVELNKDDFRKWRNGEYKDAILICEDGTVSLPTGEGQGGAYICGSEIEKMSKSKFNTVNPDDLVMKYGADTFRMYEMFLGPVEMSKPWDTKGIEGVHRFLKKLWRLFFDEVKGKVWTEEKATDAELKILHKTIKKIEEDTERFSFNTGVSTFMICINELTDLKCHKKEILEPLLILLAPYAPHIAEELYAQLRISPLSTGWRGAGGEGSILYASFPKWEEKYIKETSKAYPVAINGKTRAELTIALDATQQQVEEIVLQDAAVQKWLDGKTPKKIIYVKNKMINVVV
ncbi:MAG: leucine--tRNA ligase [Bacteroidota bacterium]